MNQPWQQPFPGQQPQAPIGQPLPPPQTAWQPVGQPQAPQQPLQPANVAAAAQTNAFAQMLAAPPRARRNRERPADGTHIVQFTRDTKMDVSQTNFQPYLLVSYTVIESTVPQMVNRTFSSPIMLHTRGSVQALAEMAKVVFGPQAVAQMASQGASPVMIATALSQHLCNQQTGQGLFALLNTWRSKKGQNGGPPPSYDDAFVNHDWMMAHNALFSLAQAQAAGHQVRMSQPAPAPTVPGAWGGGAVVPAQQAAWAPPQPQQPPQQVQQPAWAPPQPQQPPQQAQQPAWAPPQAQQPAFPPPANVQQPPASQPPQAFFPQVAQQPFPPAPR